MIQKKLNGILYMISQLVIVQNNLDIHIICFLFNVIYVFILLHVKKKESKS
jgi:hypothetical protein